ncbi:hypothetical protein BSKO_04364 [Bryopsis sp. KO-2023]|nr:hypothetical protein BSKO_04364 [Bryopsis sp. KO-2023]
MELYKFAETDKLGEGTFGTVFQGSEISSGRTVAAKRAKSSACQDEGIPVTVIREVGMLKLLNQEGEHIVRLENHFFEEEKDPSVLLVFEKHECDMKKFADKHCSRFPGSAKNGSLRPTLIKHLMKELLIGVNQLHSQCVAHRDLKPQNILVSTKPNSKPVVRIADLGMARNLTMPISTYTHEVVTLWYRAPEILLGGHYTYQIDMWSVGCIFAELFLGKPLFRADCEIYQLINIFEMLGLPNEEIWPGVTKLPCWHEYPRFKPGKLNTKMEECMNGDNDALDLLVKMLHCNPSQRIHAFDALQHPYFTARILETSQSRG